MLKRCINCVLLFNYKHKIFMVQLSSVAFMHLIDLDIIKRVKIDEKQQNISIVISDDEDKFS